MRVDVKITNKQALEIAKSIYNSNFRVFGIYNFDVELEEFANIIEIAFNNTKDTSKEIISNYYDQLLRELK